MHPVEYRLRNILSEIYKVITQILQQIIQIICPLHLREDYISYYQIN